METLQQEQERMLDKIIRESDANSGFDRFHKRSATLQEIAITSACIAGWARFERKAQTREALPLVDVGSSVIAVPVDGSQTTGGIGGWVEPGVAFEHSSSNERLKTEVIKSVDDSTPVERSSASAHSSCACCGLRPQHGYDVHIDELAYANKGGNSLSPILDANEGE